MSEERAQWLNVYGTTIRLSGEPAAVQGLRSHFATFATGPSSDPEITLDLRQQAPRLDLPIRQQADQVLDRGVVYNVGAITWVDHHGHAVSRYDFDEERGTISAPVVDDLIELGYLVLSSRLGVKLEQRGLFRVHALGFVVQGTATLLLGASGTGKSRLALALLRRTDAFLLSDDVVLVDRSGLAHPFPHPIGVARPEEATGLAPAHRFVRRGHATKWLLDLDALATRHAQGPAPVRLVAELVRVSGPPSQIRRASWRRIGGLLWRDLVVGLGLPQVLELVARRGYRDLWRQAPSAMRRSMAAAVVVRRAEPATLESFDPDQAADLIVKAVGEPRRRWDLIG